MTLYRNLPETPGVYLMKDAKGSILYVGKAVNLKRRVSSYFLRPHDSRIERLVREIWKIEVRKTDTAIEALILEADLIKKYQPPFNIREKDDKSFPYVVITKERFPRVLSVRGKELKKVRLAPSLNEHSRKRSVRKHEERNARFSAGYYGPFTSPSSIREALRILRKIFPWNTHLPKDIGRGKPCFDAQIGLCPGFCVSMEGRTEYLKTVRNIKLLFEGKKKRIITNLEREMRDVSKKLEFEKAEKIKKRLFALKHIQDVALLSEENLKFKISNLKLRHSRIEGYDVSHISGTSAVGAMVVFEEGKPAKQWYRKFRIRTLKKPNDVGMLKEMLSRRFRHIGEANWPKPDLVLIDGGTGQVRVARDVLRATGLNIPVVGIAKGPERKKNDIIGRIPGFTNEATLVRVRDEAHRFAITYHKKVRKAEFLP